MFKRAGAKRRAIFTCALFFSQAFPFLFLATLFSLATFLLSIFLSTFFFPLLLFSRFSC